MEGTITKINLHPTFPYQVRWSNQTGNGYGNKDLILISGEPQYEIY